MQAAPKQFAREQLFRWFFFGVFAVILWQLIRVFSAFLTGFLWAGILTVMFYPLHARLLRTKRLTNNMSALISTLCVLLVFILPILLLAWLTIKEASTVYPAMQGWAAELRSFGNSPGLGVLPAPLDEYAARVQELAGPLGVDLRDMALKNINQVTGVIAEAGTGIARNLLIWLFNLIVLVFALFFLFVDGSALIRWAVDLIPMETQHKKHLLEQVNATFSAVVRGFLAVAIIQGVAAGLGFWVAGVPFPLLLGAACIPAAFIPIGGCTLIWGPVVAYLILKDIPGGWPLLAWCGIVVSGIDGILKAWLIGAQIRVPVLLLFLSLLGGLQTYGFLGVLLGPLLLTCALVFVRIYREEYHLRLPTEPKPQES